MHEMSSTTFRRLTGWMVGVLVVGTLTLQVIGLFVLYDQVQQSNNRLATIQQVSAENTLRARLQNRCVSWEAQNTLLQLVLLSPGIKADELARIRQAIPLPSLLVANPDGTSFELDCDKLIHQPVPGVPGTSQQPSP